MIRVHAVAAKNIKIAVARIINGSIYEKNIQNENLFPIKDCDVCNRISFSESHVFHSIGSNTLDHFKVTIMIEEFLRRPPGAGEPFIRQLLREGAPRHAVRERRDRGHDAQALPLRERCRLGRRS